MAVDDDPAALDILTAILEPKGYQVIVVKDSREAVNLLEVDKVDGLFVDVEMPHLNGFALSAAARKKAIEGVAPEKARKIAASEPVSPKVKRGKTKKPLAPERVAAILDALRVGLNTDDSIRAAKGPDRPVNGLEARARVLSALAAVDLVTPFEEETPLELIRAARPHLLVKGGDFGRSYSNKLMRLRVVLQFIAICVLVAAAFAMHVKM